MSRLMERLTSKINVKKQSAKRALMFINVHSCLFDKLQFTELYKTFHNALNRHS